MTTDPVHGATPDAPVEFTAVVVTFNEAGHLEECLNGLTFCQELIVIDLGSRDESIAIAEHFGATVVRHPHVPIVEEARLAGVQHAAHDWIVLADPDEVLPAELVDAITAAVLAAPEVGIVRLPRSNYFRGKALDCTFWGLGDTDAARVVHRERVEFSPLVHRGIHLRPGYAETRIAAKHGYSIRHYWADSYQQLLDKHTRYIEHEGQALYEIGERFTWRGLVRATAIALRRNLVDYRGLRGGITGTFLSLFYAWYVFMSRLSLLRYERSIARD